jgi:hypothetical protein
MSDLVSVLLGAGLLALLVLAFLLANAWHAAWAWRVAGRGVAAPPPQLTEAQDAAIHRLRGRIAVLRAPNRTDTEIRAALRIEGWSEAAIDAALARDGGGA